MSSNPVDTLNDKYLRLWGIPLMVLAALLGLMPFFYPGRWDLFAWYLPCGLLYTSLTWEFCRWTLLSVRRRLPGLENTRRRVTQSVVVFVISTAIGQLILNGLFYKFGLTPPGLVGSPFFHLWLVNYASAMFFVFLNSSIYEAIYFFSQYKAAIQKAEQLKKSQIQQQLDTLKNRVNPHFLFNSLTTLSALIGEDAVRAERFVDELSKVYRYLLKAGRQSVATLGEELQFADSYAFLLKNRFETEAFTLSDNCRGNAETPRLPTICEQPVPMLSLQNVLDYLVRIQNTPLHIRIEAVKDELVVSCTDHPKSRVFDSVSGDWEQLKHHGATQKTNSGRLEIRIPFASNQTLS